MGFPQQLPIKMFLILSTPIFIRHFYGTIYWFISNLFIELSYWLIQLMMFPIVMVYDISVFFFWNFETFWSVFLTIAMDYTDVMIYSGLIFYLYKLLLKLSIVLKALKKFMSNPVSWLRDYLKNKYVSRYGRRLAALYRLKNLFKRIFRG